MRDDTIDPGTVTRDVGGCPVTHFSVFDDQEAGRYWAEAAALREETPAFFNAHAQRYWVVTRYDAVKELYQNVDLFSSESFTAWEPDPPYRFVPTQIDPPEHIKYRQLLNPRFSPGAADRADASMRAIGRPMVGEIELDDEVAPPGGGGFAGGPHRCLGAYLARRAMAVAVEEWHAAIPDYRIATDEPLLERGGQLALLSLPLAWDTDKE